MPPDPDKPENPPPDDEEHGSGLAKAFKEIEDKRHPDEPTGVGTGTGDTKAG